MKICFFTKLYPSKELPQYCIFLEQLAKEVSKRAELVVVTPSQEENKKAVLNGIDIIYINKENFYSEFETVLKENKFDLVDFHFGSLALYKKVYNLCKKNKAKFVFHFHGLNILRNFYEKHKIYAFLHSFELKYWYKKADAIIGVSGLTCEMAKRKVGKKEVYVVYNGVDTDSFYPVSEERESDTVKLLSVGNLIKIKGQEYIIRACKLLVDSGIENFKLDIYGRGVEEERLKLLTAECGLQEKINFCGYVDYDIVAEKMREADIFVLPSYFEALGCVYLEAMASKSLVMACENQGIAEIIKDGENGRLVAEKNEQALFCALKEMITDKVKREKIAEQGYKDVMNYTWGKAAEDLLKVYESIIKGEC